MLGKQTKDQENGCAPITPSCLVFIEGFHHGGMEGNGSQQSPDGRRGTAPSRRVVSCSRKDVEVTGIMLGGRGSSEVVVLRDEKGTSRDGDGDEKHLILRLVVIVILSYVFVSSPTAKTQNGKTILRQKQVQPPSSGRSCNIWVPVVFRCLKSRRHR